MNKYLDDEGKIVEREAGAYQYLDEKFQIIHVTSVPMTDQEALEYFSLVHVWLPSAPPRYILKRAVDSSKFAMMPYTYDPETEEVNPIEGAQES